MGPVGPVHFIHLGGELEWQHWRAVKTAAVHDAPIILWSAEDVVSQMVGLSIRRLNIRPWLLDHPIRLANVKDLVAYDTLYNHGGMYLDFDTISLRPAWDLLEHDLCVSREYHPADPHPHPYNTAAMIGRKGADVLEVAYHRAEFKLIGGERTWGAVGPHLMTNLVADYPGQIDVAPYRALNGWSYHEIGDYYANPRDPGDEVRVIHLYSSDHPEWLEDTWMP